MKTTKKEDGFRKLWRQYGGDFQGPLLDLATMSEENLQRMMHNLKLVQDKQADKEGWGNPYEFTNLGELQFIEPEAEKIMEELRKNIATQKHIGITVQGPYMTLRFGGGDRLVQVSFQVTHITDSKLRNYEETPQ
jgi:hypothetical protein